MRELGLSRWYGAMVVAGLALSGAACATSPSSRTPSLPQPPSAPAPPTTPQVPTTSPSGSKEEAKGEKAGQSGEKAGQAGEQGDEAGEQADKAGEQSAARGEQGGSGEKAEASGGQGGLAGGSAGGGARTPEEQRDALDRQLQTSMAAFDGMLLEQQKALEEKQRKDPLPDRSGEGSGGAGASGGASGGEGKAGAGGHDDRTAAEKRADAEAEAAGRQAKAEEGAKGEKGQSGEKGEARSADTGTGGSTDAGKLEGGAPVTAPVEGGPAGPGTDTPAAPPDVGDGKDDDVVARQLREAAMKEKDPAIREKLWDEYREYKKGTGKGGS